MYGCIYVHMCTVFMYAFVLYMNYEIGAFCGLCMVQVNIDGSSMANVIAP